jgi:hypothetical protein
MATEKNLREELLNQDHVGTRSPAKIRCPAMDQAGSRG